jgi:ribosome-associated heat shock protein Hsp15
LTDAPRATIRLDKWLWHARFFKARTQATALVAEGRVRVNSERVTKPARAVGEGDVLTFPQGDAIRVIRIVALGLRRGPATEAQTLYEDLTPASNPTSEVDENPPNPRFEGKGRPGKRERRNMLTEGRPGFDDLLE